MLTVAEVLKFPIFSQARTVAGAGGLQREVRWVHVTDIPHAAETVTGGELLLTSGYGLPEVPAAQRQFVVELDEVGLAGLVVAVGQYVAEIPPAMLACAEERQFPIISLPWETAFVDITREVHEQLISRQYALLRKSDHIHRTLNNIVLEGGGLAELAGALAELVHCPVTIEDPDLNLLAYAPGGETDAARDASIERGRTPRAVRAYLQQSGLLAQIDSAMQPLRLPPMPEHGMTKERLVAPIIVERQTYGYLWLIADDRPLGDLDTHAVERAAMVAALIMLKDRAVREAEARLQAEVITQLLSGSRPSPALFEQTARLGLNLEQPLQVAVLRPPSTAPSPHEIGRQLGAQLARESQSGLLHPLGRNLVLLLPAQAKIVDLCQRLCKLVPGMRAGVGSIAATPADLGQSYQQAREALQVGERLAHGNGQTRKVFSFDELGFLHWLYHLPPQARAGNPFAARIDTLANEDRAQRAQLLQTLEAFLDCGGNAAETARRLTIHRNTLAYRLKQIENLCDVSLNDPEIRLNLQIALKAYHLGQVNQ